MSATSEQTQSEGIMSVAAVQNVLRDVVGSADMYPGMEQYLYGDGLEMGSPQHEYLSEIATLLDSSEKRDWASAVESLIDLMRLDSPPISRLHAVDVLGAIGRRHLDLVASRVHGPEWFVTRNVVIALAKTKDFEASDAVLSVAGHSDPRVRVEVVRAAAVLDFEGSIPYLVEAMADHSQLVRDAAFTRLRAHPGPEVAAELSDAILDGRLRATMARRGVGLIAERSDPTSGTALRRIATARSLRPAVRAAVRDARRHVKERPAAA